MTQDTSKPYRADPYADEELVPFDVRDYSGRRAMWMLGGLVLIGLIAAIVIFNLYQPGVRDRAEPPLISAEETPYKIEPENPEGEVTPNQDKEVYDVLNGTAEVKPVENTITAETPAELPDKATIVVDGDEPAEVKEPEIKEPEPVIEQPAVQPAPRPRVQSGGSNYVVQVASVRSQAVAEQTWTTVSRNFSDIIPSSAYSDIKRVDLADKGIYFRLRIAGLASQDAAKRLCDQLKSRDQACYVTSK